MWSSGHINLRGTPLTEPFQLYQSWERQRTIHWMTSPRPCLFVPRGWHLEENTLNSIDGEPISGSLLDFELYSFSITPKPTSSRRFRPLTSICPSSKVTLKKQGCGMMFLYSHRHSSVRIPMGATKRSTVLVETILATFQLHENIVGRTRKVDHSAGLSCGRWDYIFSFIKKFRNRARPILCPTARRWRWPYHLCEPIRSSSARNRATPAWRPHAIGGKAAQIPSQGWSTG